MSNLKNLPTLTQLVITTTANKGVGFASILYTNKEGETAKHLVNVNASLSNAKAKDLETLKAVTDKDLLPLVSEEKKITLEVLIEAKNALIESIVNPNQNRSQAQINAFTKINDSMKYHNETGDIYLFALRVRKDVIVGIERKAVNSKPLTIAKRIIEKSLDLKAPKFVNFKIDQMFTAKLNGDVLEFQQK